jgi:hypothetical protein
MSADAAFLAVFLTTSITHLTLENVSRLNLKHSKRPN